MSGSSPPCPTTRLVGCSRAFAEGMRVEEQIEGVQVVRTWLKPSNSARTFPRLVSYFTFAATSLLFGITGMGRRDIVFIESPPLFLVLPGLLIGRMAKARIVMNVSDVWPETGLRIGLQMRRVPLLLLERLERLGYEKSDLVTATTPKASESIAERFPQVATAVIPGGTDVDLFRPSRRSHALRASLALDEGGTLVGYCGLHGLFQGLEVMVRAAQAFRDDPNIKFVLAGDGPTKAMLVELAKASGLDNVVFKPPLPRDEVGELVASFDLALVPLAAELPGSHALEGLRNPGVRGSSDCLRGVRSGHVGDGSRARPRGAATGRRCAGGRNRGSPRRPGGAQANRKESARSGETLRYR